MKKHVLSTVLLASLLCAGTASANISVGTATGNTPAGGPTTPPTIPIAFTGDGDNTVGFQVRVVFSTTSFPTDPVVTGANGAVCNVQAGPVAGTRAIFVQYNDPGNVPIPTGPTTFCNAAFTVPPAAPAGAIPLDAQFIAGLGDGCFDAMAAATTCTLTDGAVTITTGPSGPTLAYNPAATTAIVVPASISGTAITTSIVVTPSGGDTGESTTLACSVSGTGYVSTVTGSPFASGSTTPGSIGLGCAGTAGAQTLTCTQTRSGTGGGTTVSTWPLTCASAPGFASTPAPGGTLNIVGITGSTAVGAVNVSNPGTAALTLSGCAVTGTGLTLGTVTASIASGGTGSIGVSCAVPATAGSTLTGTLTCATNAAAPNNNVTYPVSCLAQSASIPTLGFGGKALMVLLMLGFGLVGFQLYRRSA